MNHPIRVYDPGGVLPTRLSCFLRSCRHPIRNMVTCGILSRRSWTSCTRHRPPSVRAVEVGCRSWYQRRVISNTANTGTQRERTFGTATAVLSRLVKATPLDLSRDRRVGGCSGHLARPMSTCESPAQSSLAAPAVRMERVHPDSLLRLGLTGIPEAGTGPLPESIKEAALRGLRATTPGWRYSDIKDSDGENSQDTGHGQPEKRLSAAFSMRALVGGMTNAVFRCSKPSGGNRTVILRHFGEGTEMFFSRDDELRTFKLLAEKGFGPALLATFQDGRVEEFLEGRALVAKDMRDPTISNLVARRVAELHSLDLASDGGESSLIFQNLEKFHQKALRQCGETYGGVDVVELGALARELRDRLQSRVPSKRVFCHNDLQCGNIMYNRKAASANETSSLEADTTAAEASNTTPTSSSTPSASPRLLSLIDYEYAGFSPRGFDLGNHFCEWMADYSTDEPHVIDLERYPSIEERRSFCRSYLGTIHGTPIEEVSADDVDGLMLEADAYSLASHLVWAMWALLQSQSGTVGLGFDYLQYATQRIRAYRKFSERFLPA